MKKNLNKTENKFFLIFFIIIVLIGFSSLINDEKDISTIENRKLNKFPHLTISTYLNSEFQNSFDAALSDQFFLSEEIKTFMNNNIKSTSYKNINKNLCKNRYVKIITGFDIFNCSDSIIYNHIEYTKDDEIMLSKVINNISERLGDKAYFYYIYDSYNFDFKNNKPIHDISKLLSNTNHDILSFKNYEEYLKYFYKTDHHWNYNGSYKGYKDIVKLLNLDEPLVPKEKIDFDIEFRGSMSRKTGIKYFYDKFSAYKFDFKNHVEYINGKEGIYGNYLEYYKNNYGKNLYVNHYAEYYGFDFREIIYDYNDYTKDNLLIISSSFSNAVNSLIASHFNKTYVIDLRYWENDFNLEDYINNNDIDKVLFLGNYFFFTSEELINNLGV